MAQHTAAHYFIEGLRDLGVEFIFSNLGTDHAPLIEELARHEAEGDVRLRPILCPHESLALHMALGYGALTGRGQVVLVHVDAGSANAALGLHNAFRSRMPVLLIAGRAPFTSHGELLGGRDNYVHFIQEPYDQASLVRPFIKWEADLPSGVVAKEMLRRAYSVMSSDPPGPAYMSLRRETLTQSWDSADIADFPDSDYGACRLGGADPDQIERVVERLLAARSPLLITSYAGRNPAAADALARFATLAGVRVVEANAQRLNIARNHPCFAGFNAGDALPDTDLGILMDVDVPWIPADVGPAAGSHWIQIDVDPIKRDLPLWPYAVHQRIAADSSRVLEQLCAALESRRDAAFTARAAQRVASLAEQARARREAAAALAKRVGSAPGTVSAHHLCAAVARQMGDDAILINEAVRSSGIVATQIPRTRAGTYFHNGGGGLGWSAGMALGAKLACPRRDVVRIVGDGTFYLGNPTSFFAAARQYELPTLTVVLDNGGWAAVKSATERVYPDGYAHRANQFQAVLPAGVDFSQVAQAAGAYGVTIDDPAQVEAAVSSCFEQIRAGRSALLHARIATL